MTGTFTAVADGLAFPESPRWRDGRLWFVEKRAGRVVSTAPDGVDILVEVDVPGGPGGIGWGPDGDLLVVSAADRRLLRWTGADLQVVADLSGLTVGRCNDLVVDGTGRAYVGHFGYDLLAGAPPAAASLVLVERDGSASIAADDLAFPNGAVITPDGSTLIVAESGANRLTAFDVGADGTLHGRRSFAELGTVVPDGIALDAAGAIWVADPIGCQVVRVIEGGDITDVLPTGELGAFACALGGVDGRTLFACLYSESASQRADGEPIGSVVSAPVDVAAAAPPAP